MDVLALAQKADLFAALDRADKHHGLVLDKIKLPLDIKDGDPTVFTSFMIEGDTAIDDVYIHAFMKAIGETIFVPANKNDGIYMNTEGDGAYLLKDSDLDAYLAELQKAKIPHKKDTGFEILPEDNGMVFKYNKQNALQIIEALEFIATFKKDKKEDITASTEKKKVKRDKLKAAVKKATETKQEKLKRQFQEILERKRNGA